MMTLKESIRLTLTANYARFSGRASRSEFWWFLLFIEIVSYVLNFILNGVLILSSLPQILQKTPAADRFNQNITTMPMIVMGIFYLALLLPLLGLAVRRLHDKDMSGWLLLLYLVPVINIFFAICVLVLSCQEGTQGSNKYGPDPIRPNAMADVFA